MKILVGVNVNLLFYKLLSFQRFGKKILTGVLIHTCNHGTWEAEVRGP